tara:strand:- start:313 stop:3177 length:2865 start_codon:yes stop_codon:yes gene_type:complete
MANLAQGLKAFFKNQIDQAEEKSFGGLTPTDDITPGPGGSLIIKGMDDSDVEALNATLEAGGFKGGLNLGRIGEIFAENADDFNIETVLTNIKNNNKELFKHLRRDKKSMEELLNQSGFQDAAYKLLKRKPGEVLPPDDVLTGIVAFIKLGKELQHTALKAKNSTDVEVRKAEFKKLQIMATVQSNLAAQVSGNVSEFARGMAVVRNVSKLQDFNLQEISEGLDQWVNEADEGMIDYHLEAFLQMNSPLARAKYAEQGFLAKTYDIAMENYINALLSSPTTHIVNMAGNASFQFLSLAERGLAGTIGNIRTLGGLRGEVGDQRYVGEAAAEMHGMMMAQKDALLLMAKTFVTGEGGDLVSKIDLKNRRALGSSDNVADVYEAMAQGDFFKASVDTLGIATRIPGRLLASEDEYFKVVSMRRVLYREAHRESQIAYTMARRSGIDRATAKQMAQDKYSDVMINPSDSLKEMMKTEARKMTFQGTPEGVFGYVAKGVNIPYLKPVVPFVNTPTNIVKEAFDRTLNIYSVYNAVKKGSGPELDDALAKLALGNTIAMTMFGIANGDYGDEIVINGSGPQNFSTNINVMGAANVPPYSIGIKQDDGTYEYTTFSRLDPMSALLIMGADLAQYSKYHEEDISLLDPKDYDDIIKNYVLAVSDYATNMPFLQGVAEFQAAAGGQFQTKEDFIKRMAKWTGAQVGNVGTNVVGNIDRATFGLPSYAVNTLSDGKYNLISQSAFSALMERMHNPLASNTMLGEGTDPLTGELMTEVPAFLQGFYIALNKAKSRNPYTSDDLPVGLNFWGNPRTQGKGTLGESLSPFRVQQGGYSDVDKELIRLSEIGAGSLSFHSQRVEQVLLNSNEFNQFVRFVNEVDSEGRVLGEVGFDPDDTLLNALRDEITNSESDYFSLPTDEDRFDALNSIITNRRQGARKRLIKETPSLQHLKQDDNDMMTNVFD